MCYSWFHICHTRYNPILRLRTDVNDSIEVHDNEVNPRGGNSCTSPHNIISTQMHALSSSVQLLILCICYSLYFKFQTSLGLATTQCCRFFTCCLHRFAVFLSLLYQPAFYSMHTGWDLETLLNRPQLPRLGVARTCPKWSKAMSRRVVRIPDYRDH